MIEPQHEISINYAINYAINNYKKLRLKQKGGQLVYFFSACLDSSAAVNRALLIPTFFSSSMSSPD